MFGDRPALSPPEIFYQRMLAGDPTEASDKAEEFLKERSLISYYDEVALKGLQLAQADADRGALDQERLTKIRDAAIEFAGNLSDRIIGRPPTTARRPMQKRGGPQWRAFLKTRHTHICRLSASKTCPPSGRASVLFCVWLAVV